MSAHLARAELLLQQRRPGDAAAEARLALAQDPQNAHAHALLAMALLDQEENDAAIEEAKAAIGLAPDDAFFHFVLARVLHLADRDDEALASVNEALRLSPDDERLFALRASIQLARRDWPAALADAEAGLAIDAQDVNCANLRAMALVRLGRKSEAMQTVDYALERDPENAVSHANQGWNCLHRNDPRRAQEFFREALRLAPEMEYARQGMLEALKANNPVYRGILAYYLWVGRQSQKLRWAFVAGTLVGGQLLRVGASTGSGWSRLLWPVLGLFYLFIYLSWTAGPMFNLLLRLNRFGRLVLSRDERRGSTWFGVSALGIVAAGVWWARGAGEAGMFATIIAAMLSVCVAATVSRSGRARKILGLATAALLAVAASGFILALTGKDGNVLTLFFLLFVGFQFLANSLEN